MPQPVPCDVDPWALIRADELATSSAERGARGAWYTPRAVAETICERAFSVGADRVPSLVVDPTCGGGAFLVAALDRLVADGVPPEAALERVGGLDVDQGAVDTARRALGCWAQLHGVRPRPERVRLGDALGPWPPEWPRPDLVLGNPPFASPLRSAAGAAGLPPAAESFRRRHRTELGPYADLAAIHLLNAVHRLDPARGRLAMVLPQSMLAGRDASLLRGWLDDNLPLQDMWITGERVFDASVHVFAPILGGGGGTSAAVDVRTWAERAASVMGVPDPGIDGAVGRLGDRCATTAGFRDEYYGLRDACVEGDPDDVRSRLVTVGAIDPLVCHWGDRPTRFAKRRWQHPVVDVATVPDTIRSWFDRQRQPKVLLPTQAKILEPFVDRSGQWIPVTPLLSIIADPDDLDLVAALLLAPSVVAWAARRSFGSALSTTAIKLRAGDVSDLPLPEDREAWTAAAALIPEGPDVVDEVARLMQRAFGADADLLEWWRARR